MIPSVPQCHLLFRFHLAYKSLLARYVSKMGSSSIRRKKPGVRNQTVGYLIALKVMICMDRGNNVRKKCQTEQKCTKNMRARSRKKVTRRKDTSERGPPEPVSSLRRERS